MNRKNLKFLPLIIFTLPLFGCKPQNGEISYTQKMGNYTFVQNVSYRYNREIFKVEVWKNGVDNFSYTIPLEDVYSYPFDIYGDDGRVYNEFCVELKHLYIYASR